MRRLLAIITYLVLVFSSSAFADGELTVMDTVQYLRDKDSFFSAVESLDSSLTSVYQFYGARLSVATQELYWARSNIRVCDAAASAIINNNNSPSDVQNATTIMVFLSTADDQVASSLQSLGTLLAAMENDYTQLHNQISTITNFYPIPIGVTNATVNVYVLVTNDFAMCSNMYNSAEGSYTNFLNYYEGSGNLVLDQYRQTVTNLLNWSEFPNWYDYTFWNYKNTYYGYNSNQYLWNINFEQFTERLTGSLYTHMYPSPNGSYFDKHYLAYSSTIPDGATYADYLNFLLIGYHDSLQALAEDSRRTYTMIGLAATSVVPTMIGATSAMTNSYLQMMRLQSSADLTVQQIGRSRNYYQRIERYLASIFYNTAKDDVEINEDATRAQGLETMANDAQEQAESISNEFAIVEQRTSSTLAVMTNTWSSIANLLSPFVPDDKPQRTLRAGNDDQGIKLMSMQFVGDRLRDLTKKGNDVPSSLVISDTVFNESLGNEAQKIEVVSTMSKLKEIAHTTFGIIWMLLFFGISFFECFYFMKTAINIWWKALRFIPDVSRYMFGN